MGTRAEFKRQLGGLRLAAGDCFEWAPNGVVASEVGLLLLKAFNDAFSLPAKTAPHPAVLIQLNKIAHALAALSDLTMGSGIIAADGNNAVAVAVAMLQLGFGGIGAIPDAEDREAMIRFARKAADVADAVVELPRTGQHNRSDVLWRWLNFGAQE